MSTKPGGDKKILVSFTSDSEDEANTSSSSALSSSRDEASSSEDERTAKSRKFGSSFTRSGARGGKGDAKNEEPPAKPIASKSDKVEVTDDSSTKVKAGKVRNGPAEEVILATKLQTTEASAPVTNQDVETKKSKKASKIEEPVEDVKPVKVVKDLEPEPKSSKKRSDDSLQASTKLSSKDEVAVDPEERNLAPPTKSKTKSRSKSPRELMEETEQAAPVSVKEAAPIEMPSEEPAPSKSSTKSRSKSSKTSDVPDEPKAVEVAAKSEPVAVEPPAADTSADVVLDKSPKTKKKKKQASDSVEEVEVTSVEVPTTASSSDSKLPILESKPKKTKEREAELPVPAPTLPLTEVTTKPISDDDKSAAKSSKTSKKSGRGSAENIPAGVNGEAELEIPTNVICPESPAIKKKHKKLAEEAEKAELETLGAAKGTAAPDVKPNVEPAPSAVTEEVDAVEKPKKKKASKAAESLDAMLSEKPSADSIGVTQEKVENLSSLKDHKPTGVESLPDLPVSSSRGLQSAPEQVLEQPLQEKFDAVAINEVQDLPNNEITIVKPVSELSSKSAVIDTTSEADKKSSIEDVAKPEQPEKQSSDSLSDEVARYLNSLSGSKYTSAETSEATPAAAAEKVDKPSRPAGEDKSVEEENSEFTYRRQSMDDFIKKILAEAREERIKLKGGIADEGDVPVGDKPPLSESTAASRDLLGDDKENSMLERRLASVEKKRLEAGGEKSLAGERLNGIGAPGKSKLEDSDSEVSRILNARRAQRKAMEEMGDDADSLISDAASSRFRGRFGAKGRDDYPDDDESFSSSKPPLLRNRAQNLDDDEPGAKESFVAKYRREREASQLPEDSFAPRRSDQTDDVIRERTRHIRIIVEQQADVAKSMRATARNMDELDNEIREVRQLSLDWQARIEALEAAVDSEYHSYEADQQAATERIRQQHMPDDRYLREELRGGMRPRTGNRLRGESAEDEGYGPGSRRRSGSVASNTSLGSGFVGRATGGTDSGLDLDYLLGGGGMRRDRRAGSESDFTSDRLRRGGSLTRDKYVTDMLGLGGEGDDYGLPSRSRAGSQRADLPAAPQASDEVMRIRAKYSQLANDSGAGSYNLPSRASGGLSSDLGGSSYLYPSPSYSSDSRTSGLGLRRSETPLSSSRYGDTSSTSRYPSTTGYGGGSGLSLLESSRMRRAQSVSDMNFDRPSSYRSGGGSGFNEPGTDYRSKFLSRVRSKNDDLAGSGSTSSLLGGAAGLRSKDKPFKSRFLKSSSAFDSSPSPSRFSGGGLSNGFGGGSGGAPGAGEGLE